MARYGIVNGAGAVCDQKISKFFVQCGRIHDRTCGYKGSLLKIRERKYKGEHGGCRQSLLADRASFFFSGTFKTYMGKAEPGDSHPIIMSGERPGQTLSPSSHSEFSMTPKPSLILACLSMVWYGMCTDPRDTGVSPVHPTL
jgi:hypothetical protein